MHRFAQRFAAVCLCFPLLLAPRSAEGADEAAIPIGSQRELLVDDYLIDSMTGVELRLHHPTPEEVVLTLDAPWEGNTCAYVTVFRDGAKYRMYYRGSRIDVKTRQRREQVTCYAESEDGIRWTKPKLGIIECENSTENNIVCTGEAAHNFCPFKDENPDCPEDARYKAVGFGEGPDGRRALAAFVSSDGLHFKPLQDGPISPAGSSIPRISPFGTHFGASTGPTIATSAKAAATSRLPPRKTSSGGRPASGSTTAMPRRNTSTRTRFGRTTGRPIC